MPIFEYKCSECESKFEILTKNNNDHKVSCPDCNSSKIKKLFSTFSASTGSVSYSDNGCATGNCNVDVPGVSGCASGMCGLN
ncbi:MAG: zinc ribbon domain-containing protein [Ignavibacteriaceae bacterium]|jgi:putative FmdB family regulatory protein